MDYLSKKHEYVFLNNRNAMVRVHVTKVTSFPFEIWSEGKSKKYRDCVKLLKENLTNYLYNDLPPIIIVDNKKLGIGAISSYNHNDDVIYYNSYYNNYTKIQKIVSDETFSARNLKDIILHELAHKRHWDAVKRFYHANESKYNSIIDAKRYLDSDLESYLSKQISMNLSYISSTISIYAEKSFKDAKDNLSSNAVNEIIAEVFVQHKLIDPKLNDLVRKELNYGKA